MASARSTPTTIAIGLEKTSLSDLSNAGCPRPVVYKQSLNHLTATAKLRSACLDVQRYSTSDDDSGCIMDEYAWVPPGLDAEGVHLYYSCIPAEKVPLVNSVGEKWRTNQLQYQHPSQDSDPLYCGNLTEMEENELRTIEQKRRLECFGQGMVIRAPGASVALGCHQCKCLIQANELVVSAPDRFACSVFWHPQCFVCVECNELLVDHLYYRHDGNVYCGRHHAERIKPRCGNCDELIFCSECTEAEGRVWHMKHFICCRCDCQLGGKRYIVHNDQPYCTKCYKKSAQIRCNTCRKEIVAEKSHITQGQTHWHADERCFCCAVCEKNLLGRRYSFVDGRLLCGVNSCSRTKSAVSPDFPQPSPLCFQIPRTSSQSSVPSASPSVGGSSTPSSSASPAHSERPCSQKSCDSLNNKHGFKSPSRVRFDLRPQHFALNQQMFQTVLIAKPHPPLRDPPPPPPPLSLHTFSPQTENVYETVIPPSQYSNNLPPDFGMVDNARRSKRRSKRRNNFGNNNNDYVQSSESSSDDSTGVYRKPCVVPTPRSHSADCRQKNYSRGDDNRRRCSSCSSSSSESDIDDVYLSNYLAVSDDHPENNKNQKASLDAFKRNKSQYKRGKLVTKFAKNKKSAHNNCIVS